MKLESLKNGKYSLTPEKMGELVGGKQVVEQTGPGRVHYSGSNYWIIYSCDTITYRNEDDYNHDYSCGEYWGSSSDPTTRENYCNSYSFHPN